VFDDFRVRATPRFEAALILEDKSTLCALDEPLAFWQLIREQHRAHGFHATRTTGVIANCGNVKYMIALIIIKRSMAVIAIVAVTIIARGASHQFLCCRDTLLIVGGGGETVFVGFWSNLNQAGVYCAINDFL